jgi:hypothetical protein
MTKSKCSKCGAEFECGVNTGKCWCMNYVVPEMKLEEIKKEFTDCLCPDCLCEYAIEYREQG